jgi:biotin transport system permease protein
MPAGLKLVFVIVISAFSYASVYGLLVSVLLILLASAAARIFPPALLKGSKPLVILSLCIILLNTMTHNVKEGFFAGLLAAARIFVPYALATLLFTVTTMRELRLSLAMVEKGVTKIFSRKKHIPVFSLGISLMLGFIPRFFELWNDANLACDSRSCSRGLRRLPLLIPLVTERMMEAAQNTALALEARAFGSSD